MGERGGFTMVEVLVALSLLGLGILFVLQMSLLSLRLGTTSRRISGALCLAQERLESLRLHGWEETAGECLPPGAASELPVPSSACLQRERLGGTEYLLTLQRETAAPALDSYSVACFWENRNGAYSAESSLLLRTAMRVSP